MRRLASSFLSTALLCCNLAIAADTQPVSPAPVGGVEKLQVTITGVEGVAQYRTPPAAWKPCTVGLVLDEGVEFRTGIRSAIRFTIPPDQTITLDRLGVVKVVEAIRDHGKIKTDVGMPHGGRVRLDIEAAGIEHQSTIRSPNSTLAVTGTRVALYDQSPFPPEAISLTGRAQFATQKRRTAFGGKGAGKTQVNAGQSAAESQLAADVVDPSIRDARTPQEAALVANLISEGSTFSFAGKGSIPIVHGGTPPATDAQLLPLLPGKLDFVLRWTGNANLDLIIGTQAHGGEVMLPVGGANFTRSGGRIPFDHQGGPNGGIEIAYWNLKFPAGFYSAFVNATSGAATDFTLDVFQNKQRIPILDQFDQQVTTLTGRVAPGSNALATVPVGVATLPGPTGAPRAKSIASTEKLTDSFPVNVTANSPSETLATRHAKR
jgi:hypothetical protein